MGMSDGAELRCASPALNTLIITVKHEENLCEMGCGKTLFYTLENGKFEKVDDFLLKWELECLVTAEYGIWNWLKPIRKEERFLNLIKDIEKYVI